jgi:hypothetical protein
MKFWIQFFSSLPCWLWFGLFMIVCAIYWLLIGPILFKFWIIPRIENRYRTELVYNYSPYFYPGTRWMVHVGEISFYIFAKYMGWTKLLRSPYLTLAKLNYDVNTASKAEIVLSFVTVFIYILTIVSGIVVAVH